jgi:thiol-disulfide isomerase/thioredoxin
MVTVGIPVGVVVIVVLAFAVLALTSGSGTEKGTRSAPTGAITVSPGGSRPSPIPKGKTVPSFTAPALGGGTASWKPGQPTVLVIWAAWCPHCQAELPALQQLHTKYPDVNVVSVVSAQGQEPGPSPEELVAQDHITFPVAVDDSAQSLVNAMGVTGFPTIYFVNADGTVFDQLSGEPPELALDLGFQHLQQQV